MAACEELVVKIKTNIEYKRYLLVFFPIATFSKVDEIEKLTIFGVPVYARIGDTRNVLGYTWTQSHDR